MNETENGISLEQTNDESLTEKFERLTKSWEESSFMTSANPQLTHISSCPEVREIADMGMGAIPMVSEKLKSNIFYYLVFQRILDDEGVKVKVDMSAWDPNDEGKWSHLEPYRKAYLKWYEKKYKKGKTT